MKKGQNHHTCTVSDLTVSGTVSVRQGFGTGRTCDAGNVHPLRRGFFSVYRRKSGTVFTAAIPEELYDINGKNR